MLLGFLYDVINYGIQIMVWLIIIRVLASYMPHDPSKGIWNFIYSLTDPLYQLGAKVLPKSLRAPLDFSPMVALIVLEYVLRPLLLQIVVALLS